MPTSMFETFLEPHTKKHTQSYNELLTGLHLLICKHIASVESYRQFVQAARERERRFGTLLPSKQMTKEEKYDRITQGKARNWKRARFNPRRYQELCDRALGELWLFWQWNLPCRNCCWELAISLQSLFPLGSNTVRSIRSAPLRPMLDLTRLSTPPHVFVCDS